MPPGLEVSPRRRVPSLTPQGLPTFPAGGCARRAAPQTPTRRKHSFFSTGRLTFLLMSQKKVGRILREQDPRPPFGPFSSPGWRIFRSV